MSVAPNSRASAWRSAWRLSAMMRSAPRRLAASTPERPTAPSPTTATVPPGLTSAQTAAWWPVDMTSESASSEREHLVGVTGAGDLDERAVGERDADRLALPAVAVGGLEAAGTHAEVMPWRQCGQVPSLNANGAMTKSPLATSRHVGADVLDDADELVADRARLERRVAAVVPEVGAADAREHHAHDRRRWARRWPRSGRSPTSM